MKKNESAYVDEWGRFMVVPTSLPENDHIGIEKMTIRYTQEDDTNHHTTDGEPQTITIETEDAIVSEKEAMDDNCGYYFVIKTERWAITDENDIANLIKDFRSRLSCEKYKLKKEDGKEEERTTGDA